MAVLGPMTVSCPGMSLLSMIDMQRTMVRVTVLLTVGVRLVNVGIVVI